MKCYVIYEGDHCDRPIAYEDNIANAYEWAISRGYGDLEIENGDNIGLYEIRKRRKDNDYKGTKISD